MYGAETQGNTVIGNYIGTNVSGLQPLPNAFGVHMWEGASHNTIGGANATPGGACTGACNLISGNDCGVAIYGAETQSNSVIGNYIGTNGSGTQSLPNAVGVHIWQGASHNMIGGVNATLGHTCTGVCNVISGNDWAGIDIGVADLNVVRGNHVGADGWGKNVLEAMVPTKSASSSILVLLATLLAAAPQVKAT